MINIIIYIILMSISVIYATCRKNPKFEWFFDSLKVQCDYYNFDISKEIEIIIVDYNYQFEENKEKIEEYYSNVIDNNCEYKVVEPKPTPWQGKYKVNSKLFSSAANARNTGFIYSKNNYLWFVDDESVLEKDFIYYFLNGPYKQRLNVAFAYIKLSGIKVNNGNIDHIGESTGIDCRLKIYDNNKLHEIDGGNVFGYFACKRDAFIKVNGYDEITSGIGAEDYDLGMRLQHSGEKLYYYPKCLFYEYDHNGAPPLDGIKEECFFKEGDVFVSKEKYLDILQDISQSKVNDSIFNTYNMSHVLLERLVTTKQYNTVGNLYNINDLSKLDVKNFDKNFDNFKMLHSILLKDYIFSFVS